MKRALFLIALIGALAGCAADKQLTQCQNDIQQVEQSYVTAEPIALNNAYYTGYDDGTNKVAPLWPKPLPPCDDNSTCSSGQCDDGSAC